MKILHISNKPPYPVVDGGCFASAQLLNDLLSLKDEIKHLSISTDKHPFDRDKYPAYIRQKTAPDHVKLDTRTRPWKAFLTIFRKKSYHFERFRSVEFESKVRSCFDQNTLLIIDSLYAGAIIEHLTEEEMQRVVLRSHNVEFEIWERQANCCSNPLKRWALKKLTANLKRQECSLVSKVKSVWAISTTDQQKLSEFNKNTSLIPVSIEPKEIKVDYSVNGIFHVGSPEWKPNEEALEALIDLHKQLLQEFPTLELNLFGKDVERYANRGVKAHGFVEDLAQEASKAGILITPIKSGSGIRIKILEMMALGIPVVTTSLGAQGIEHGKHIVIAKNTSDLLEMIKKMLNDRDLRESTGTLAQAYVSEHHSPKHVQQLIQISLEPHKA